MALAKSITTSLTWQSMKRQLEKRLRFEKNWEYTLRAAEKFPPVNETLLEKLRVNAETRLVQQLSDAFIKNLYLQSK